ncbi:MAG: glycine cleavage system aminomethyltransferase GcvT [Bacteroidota bacterium]
MTETLKTIALNNKHIELGGKMVAFAGYSMPLQYSALTEEHKTVRNGVGIFDVSHMGEFLLEGTKALDLVQKVVSNDASKLAIGDAQYACLPNDQGGIVDDLLIYRMAEEAYMLVVNASNIDKDWAWISQHNDLGVQMTNQSDKLSLFAVQGPLATQVLQKLTDTDLSAVKYYTFKVGTMADIPNVIISATGYTGAGGFELYVPNAHAEKLWDAVMEAGQPEGILPIGLGARDTLRLEMGYCLYGNDIDDHTSPLEAGLGWVTKFTKPFINSEALAAQKAAGITKKLVGFEMLERGIPRKGYTILDSEGNEIGIVTSGGQSPSLEKGIGLGYVQKAFSKSGTEILIQIRKKQVKAVVKRPPFYKA